MPSSIYFLFYWKTILALSLTAFLTQWTKVFKISLVNPSLCIVYRGVLYEAASAHVGISFEADVWPSLMQDILFQLKLDVLHLDFICAMS